jgi:hypothetical protein
MGAHRGVNFNYLISSGNEISLDLADYVNYFAEDEHTRVISLFVEGIRRPQAFMAAAAKALAAGKPIIAIKTGKSQKSRDSAQSHTGAVAGDYSAFAAMCERYGIVACPTLDDMVDPALWLPPFIPFFPASFNDLRKVMGLGRDRNLEETEGLLAFELDSFLAAFAGWEGEAVDKLRRAQTSMGEWDLEDVAPSSILRSLRSSYKKGRAALADVRRRGSTRRFHKLRQRSKELWLQLRLLRPVAPETVRELSRELKKLGEDLGHAHDLCFVAQRLRDLAGMHPRQRNRKMLTSLIESREQDLQRKAVRIAQRFYERKPKKFTNRLRKSFKGWKQPNESNLSHNGAMVNASAAV